VRDERKERDFSADAPRNVSPWWDDNIIGLQLKEAETGSYLGIRHYIAVVFLLLLFALQCFLSLPHKAPTFDEVLFIPSGYAFLKTGSTLTNPEAQPLPRILSAIPLLVIQIVPPAEEPEFTRRYEWGADFLFHQNGFQTEKIVFWARVPVILLGVCLLFVIFHWSASQFGKSAAFVTLAFAALDPNLIAHSSLATSDLPLTFFFILTLYLYTLVLRQPEKFSLLFFCGISFACALLCKTTAWLLLPLLFLILAVVRPNAFLRSFWRTCGIILFAVFMVNAVFLFHGTLQDKSETMRILSIDPSEKSFARALMYFLPDQYSFAFLYNLAESSGRQHPFPFFLHGQYSNAGFWNYFFVALLIKTPISVLVWIPFSLVFLWKSADRKRALILSIPWLLLLLYFSFVNKLNLGLRHILPVYPLWFLASAAPLGLLNRKRLVALPLAFCLFWSVVSLTKIQPNHLAYFNELIGGPGNGYQYLVDSNLDWGQDLAKLKLYMLKRNLQKIQLSYFGTADPSHYGIDYDYLPSPRFQPWTLKHPDGGKFELQRGIYAISATNLQGVYLRDRNTFSIFKNRKPDDFIGNSILIFDQRAGWE
jgi:hypothetical protein